MTNSPSRPILDLEHIHPAIRAAVSEERQAWVIEVQAALATTPVVVVGMQHNPYCKKAAKAVAAQGVNYKYLEYGSYFSGWRSRNALKMWTGWPTFPMVFVHGVLIGGANDLARLIASGEFTQMVNR
jgi:glutaredoxin-related protein